MAHDAREENIRGGLDREALEAMVNPRRQARLREVLSRRSNNPAFVLEDVHDPHNISAVLRTLEGLGLHRVFVIEATTGFEVNPRVTQGAEKWLDIRRYGSAEACVKELRDLGYQLLTTRMDARLTLDELDFSRPTAVIMGNEHDGISATLDALADEAFRIPMDGFSQSFNVSVAAALIARTAALRVKEHPEWAAPITGEALEERYLDYLWLSVNQRDRFGGATDAPTLDPAEDDALK